MDLPKIYIRQGCPVDDRPSTTDTNKQPISLGQPDGFGRINSKISFITGKFTYLQIPLFHRVIFYHFMEFGMKSKIGLVCYSEILKIMFYYFMKVHSIFDL